MCTDGAEYSVKARTLYDEYRIWAEKSGEYRMSMTKFGREMAKKLPKMRKTDGYYYVGIKLKEEPIHFDWNN
jgi:putative DNA primase/helicase